MASLKQTIVNIKIIGDERDDATIEKHLIAWHERREGGERKVWELLYLQADEGHD